MKCKPVLCLPSSLSIVYYDHSPYLGHLEVRPGPIPAPLPPQELTMQNLPEKIIIFYQLIFQVWNLCIAEGLHTRRSSRVVPSDTITETGSGVV